VRLSSARTNTVVEVEADDGVPRGSAALAFNVPGLLASDLIDVATAVTDIRIETVT
jgi:hypothetical protein